MARAVSESQWLVTISGHASPIYFSGKSGGSKKASTSEYNDGLKRVNKKVRSSYTIDDITLERAYDPDVDPAFMDFIDDYCSQASGDLVITVQSIEQCSESNPIGSPMVYSGVQPMGYDTPDVNRSGSGVAMVKYMFAADDLSIG